MLPTREEIGEKLKKYDRDFRGAPVVSCRRGRGGNLQPLEVMPPKYEPRRVSGIGIGDRDVLNHVKSKFCSETVWPGRSHAGDCQAIVKGDWKRDGPLECPTQGQSVCFRFWGVL